MGVFRGLGETAAMEATDRGELIISVMVPLALNVIRVASERPGVGVGARLVWVVSLKSSRLLRFAGFGDLHTRCRPGGGVRVAVVADAYGVTTITAVALVIVSLTAFEVLPMLPALPS